MERTLAQKMLVALKCHSCSGRMKPPLFQCPWGHQYCNECVKTYSSCFQCQPPVEMRRDYLFEKLCYNTLLKCSFSEGGCDVTGYAVVIAEHEKYCPFSSISSPANDTINDKSVECDRVTSQITQSKYPCNEVTSQNSQLEESGNSKLNVGQSQLQAFLAELECPVCFKRMSFPIRQCIIGHQICHGCFDRVDQCPVCRGSKSTSVNKTLEQILLSVEVPCNYTSTGCVYHGRGIELSRHEESCTFIPKSCPLLRSGTCSWQGVESEMVSHSINVHSDLLILGSKQSMILDDFIGGPNAAFFLFYSYGVLFRCIWYRAGNEARFSVNYMGPEKYEQVFGYELNILSPGYEHVATGSRSVCAHLSDGSIAFVESNYISFPLEDLLLLCDTDLRLHHEVKIIHRDHAQE